MEAVVHDVHAADLVQLVKYMVSLRRVGTVLSVQERAPAAMIQNTKRTSHPSPDISQLVFLEQLRNVGARISHTFVLSALAAVLSCCTSLPCWM